MLLRARANGYIDKRRYQGRYCVSDERYISDGTEPANCDICGRPAELISEENYFFKLSAFQGRLLELYEKHPEFVQPDFRRNEVLSFVPKSGIGTIGEFVPATLVLIFEHFAPVRPLTGNVNVSDAACDAESLTPTLKE